MAFDDGKLRPISLTSGIAGFDDGALKPISESEVTPSASLGDFGKQLGASAFEGLGSGFQAGGQLLASGINAVAGTSLRAENPLAYPVEKIRDSISLGGKAAMRDTFKGSFADPSSIELPDTWSGGAMQLAQGLGSAASTMLPVLGVAGRGARAATAVGAISGAAQAGGAAISGEREDFDAVYGKLDDAGLQSRLPLYAELRAEGMPESEARDVMRERAANAAGLGAAAGGAIGGAVPGWAVGRLMGGKGLPGLDKIASSRLGQAAIAAPGGALFEGVQETSENMGARAASNLALGIPASDRIWDDSFANFAAGALTGGVVSGGMGALSGGKRIQPNPTEDNPAPAPVVAPDPATGPLSRAVNQLPAAPAPVLDTGLLDAEVAAPAMAQGMQGGEMQDAPPQEMPVAAKTEQPDAAGRPVLQNRDRTSAASITQIRSIASNPDYTRLGFSRDFANGAPVIEPGVSLAPQQIGKQDVATTAAGRHIPVQYAVVEASQIIPSNDGNGSPVAEYQNGADGKSRAIAGNGRIAGLQLAYSGDTAQQYRELMAADELHGISPDVIAGMQQPVLVRIMPQDQVTANIGDESNVSGVSAMSGAEQARNDARRVDLGSLEFDDQGNLTAAAVRQFVAAMPQSEQAGMLDGSQPSRQAYDRVANAIFATAYESDALVRLQAQAVDTEARTIMSALMALAGKVSRLKGTGEYDIRGLFAEAAEIAVNARRRGESLATFIEQGDLDRNPETQPILQIMADNIRSAKRMADELGRIADGFYAEASKPESDMFGAVPRRARQEILDGRTSEQENTLNSVDTGRAADDVQPGERQGDTGGQGSADVDSFALETQTEEELAALAEARKQQERAEAEQERQEQQRAQADQERDGFSLTGSDRTADVAAAAGQNDMFAPPTRGEKKAEQKPESVGQQQSDLAHLEYRIGVLRNAIDRAEGREYQRNDGRVTVGDPDAISGDSAGSRTLSIGDINERRRNRGIADLRADIRRIEQLMERIKAGSTTLAEYVDGLRQQGLLAFAWDFDPRSATMVVTAQGTPYKTERAANMGRNREELKGRQWKAVEVPGGWALEQASQQEQKADTANASFSEVAQRIAAAFGRPVQLIRNANAGFNAMFYPREGVIVANEAGDRPMYAVVTHEIYHGLPDDLRRRTTEAIMETVTPEQRARFLSEFSAYQEADAKEQDEELAARIIEQDAENPQFWQRLADRMGDSDFAELAREILGMLDRLLAGFAREDSSEFTSDIERVREVVAAAYAEAQGRMGQASDTDPMASRPRKRETVGDYQAIPYKDGAITILGDVDEIRSKLPDDVKGRVVEGGIRFTASDSQRVRAALEGRQVAYSRAGAVLDKLPMKDGKYLGAPPGYDTPGKIPTLRKILRNLTKEGEAGRFWYENSSKAVLRMTGGNVQEARKFVALLAIYSPQAKVDTNTTFAIRAWSQYKAGQPISVKTKVMDQKAAKAMQDIDAFWSGEKTGNFFFNLLREIDPATEGKQGATIDMWMMRAGMYPTDAPTKTQYAFMENETNRIAAEMGWEPQQVQAAIWVAMKARMENSGVKKRTEASSEKKGWIRFDRDAKGKKVRVILDAQKHRDNWLAHAMRHDPSTTDTKAAKFDFEDGLFRHIGQISFEARPGRTSGSLPGIHSAPYAQQVEFQQAVLRTFYDERGTDMLASYLGLMIDNDILAPGVWQGEVSPSTQMSTVMAPVGGKDGKNKVDPAQAKLLNVYASVLGLLTRQEGVGWHRPFYATTKRDANGLDIDIGRPINPLETADLERAVGAWMLSNGHQAWQDKFAFVSSPKGVRIVSFGIITNEMLQTEIVRVAESVLPDGSVRVFASSGGMPTNNWKENPNGETYIQGISAEGRSDVLDWARANLAPRIDAVFRDFSERYNWGDPGEVRFSARRNGRGRTEGAGTADRQAVPQQPASAGRGAGQNQGSQQGLTPLPGAPKVPGFHGPDPRLVAVAEKYAADNGIELRRQAEYAQVDPERAARIAEAYEAMPHAPQDPKVREAYENLIRQTKAQYDALVAAGYQFWFIDLDQPANAEYASSPWNAMRDIRANKTMGVFPTEAGFGSGDVLKDNPLETTVMDFTWPSGSLTGPRKRVLANDLFRAVHDAFGHGLEGAGFRAQGEENAWQAHVRLFTGSAVGAITSETRGQNSWLNYGPHGETNRDAQVEDTIFADQKTGLMPEWTWTEGRVADAQTDQQFVSEPTATEDGYETDLFGNPVPPPRGRAKAARSAGARVRRDVQPAAAVSSDTATPAGRYHVKTIVGTEVSRRLGADRINSFADLAQATQYLYRSAVERFDGIVTDKNGKPLAVVGGFKGAIDSASVPLAPVIAEAVRVRGAANIWLSHNHPSGLSDLSSADRNLHRAFEDAFAGSGIEVRGLIAVGRGEYTATDNTNGSIPAEGKTISVPVIEREQIGEPLEVTIESPAAARAVAVEYYGEAGRPGMILLDTRHRVVGWAPFTPSMTTGALRNTGGLNALYRAVSEGNAAAAVLAHGGELDTLLVGAHDSGMNIAAGLNKAGVRVLDVVNTETRHSRAEKGEVIVGHALYRLSDGKPKGIPLFSARAIAKKVMAATGLNATVVNTEADLPADLQAQIRRDKATGRVAGVYHNGTAYLVASNLRDTKHAVKVMLHEAVGHGGVKSVLGDRLGKVMAGIYRDMPASIRNELERRYAKQIENLSGADANALIAEEYVAHLAETDPRHSVINRLVALLRRFIRETFGKSMGMKWTRNDIVLLLAEARVAAGSRGPRGGNGARFSVTESFGQPSGYAFNAKDYRPSVVAWAKERFGERMAANGKPAWQNFVRWFGDSKVVDASGNPLVVYHGSPDLRFIQEDGTFKSERERYGLGRDTGAHWFAASQNTAKTYADPRRAFDYQRAEEGVIAAYLKIENPLVIEAGGAKWRDAQGKGKAGDVIRDAMEGGHDGIIIKGVRDNYQTGVVKGDLPTDTYVVFRSNQIKSATDNNGGFDPANPDIRYSLAQTETPAFKRWFGDSKVVDAEGKPKVMYHGTGADFSVFRAKEGMIFLSESAEFASGYAVRGVRGRRRAAPSVMPLYVRAENPFDFENPDHVRELMLMLPSSWKGEMEQLIASGDWTTLEAPEVVEAVKGSGFDGMYIWERLPEGPGAKNLAVFNRRQIKSAIGNNGNFDPANPDIRYSLNDEAETAEALRKLGLGGRDADGIIEQIRNMTLGGLKAKLGEWSTRSEEGIFDGLAGIKRAEEAVGVTDENSQGYVSARMATGIADVMHGVLHYAAPEWRDGVVSGKADTRGVLEILGDLGQDNLTPWLAWLGGKRAQMLKAQGRENNLTDADIAELLAMGQGKEELFERVYRDYAKTNEAVLDLAEQAGLIDKDARAKWATDYYVPFYRQDEAEGIFTAPRTKRGLSHQTAAIKALKGGTLPTNHLLTNMLTGWTKRIDAAMKNKALLEVVDNLKGSEFLTDESPRFQQVLISRGQIAQQIRKDRKALAMAADMLGLPEGSKFMQVANQLMKPENEGFEKLWTRVAPTDPDIIRVQRGGKNEYYRVNDESLLRGLKFMEGSVFNDPVTRIGRTFKRILTTGVTASPDFILRNFIRDAAHAWMINKDGFVLGKDSIKGMRDALREDKDYRDLMFAGGSFQGGYVHGTDPEASAQIIRRALEKKGFSRQQQDSYLGSLVNTPAKAAAMLGRGWQSYRTLSDKVENANRLSTYKAALAAGKSKRQAAFEAKDLMDYSLRGNFAAAQWFTDVVPFLNARLQGLYKLGRAMKDDKTVIAKEVAMKGAYIALFSLLLAALNDDDERYQELQDWDKDMHWHIFLGDQHFRIPKPFELGLIFGTIPERLLHALTGTQDGGDLAKAVSNGVFQTLAFNPVPQFYQPIREVQANRDFFRDRPIESMADEGKLPEARYDDRTSAIGKALGQLTGPTLGISPKQVDHLVRGYTGTLGGYVLSMSSLVADLGKPGERPDSSPSSWPVLKVLYGGSDPRSTQYHTDFYDMLSEADQLYRTVRSYREEGRMEEAAALMTDQADKLKHRRALGMARQQFGAIRKRMGEIYDDPRMSGAEKRRQLNALQLQSNQIAERMVRLAGDDF